MTNFNCPEVNLKIQPENKVELKVNPNLYPIDGVDGKNGVDGVDGKGIEVRNSGTYLQWKYIDESTWTNLIYLDDLKGQDGSQGSQGIDGKSIELNNNGVYVQWRLVGDSSWINLILLSDLKGENGQAGKDGKDGITGANGSNGSNGQEVLLQNNGTYIQWKYTNDLSWTNLILVSDLTEPVNIPGNLGNLLYSNGASSLLASTSTSAATESVIEATGANINGIKIYRKNYPEDPGTSIVIGVANTSENNTDQVAGEVYCDTDLTVRAVDSLTLSAYNIQLQAVASSWDIDAFDIMGITSLTLASGDSTPGNNKAAGNFTLHAGRTTGNQNSAIYIDTAVGVTSGAGQRQSISRFCFIGDKFGVGVLTPSATINAQSLIEQFRLGYGPSAGTASTIYFSVLVESTGETSFKTNGGTAAALTLQPVAGQNINLISTGTIKLGYDTVNNLGVTCTNAGNVNLTSTSDLSLGGKTYFKKTSKTLVEGQNTSICEVSCTTGQQISGKFSLHIEAGDGTDYQIYKGNIVFAANNKSTTVVNANSITNELNLCTSGTLTITTGITNGAGKITIYANATSSLTQTYLRCYWIISELVTGIVTPL